MRVIRRRIAKTGRGISFKSVMRNLNKLASNPGHVLSRNVVKPFVKHASNLLDDIQGDGLHQLGVSPGQQGQGLTQLGASVISKQNRTKLSKLFGSGIVKT